MGSEDERLNPMEIFISFISEDVAVARKLAALLKQNQFNMLGEKEYMEGGERYDAAEEQVLREGEIVLVLLSQHSTDSPSIKNEVLLARALKKIVIPLRIARGVMPFTDI